MDDTLIGLLKQVPTWAWVVFAYLLLRWAARAYRAELERARALNPPTPLSEEQRLRRMGNRIGLIVLAIHVAAAIALGYILRSNPPVEDAGWPDEPTWADLNVPGGG